MNRNNLSYFFKVSIIISGFICFALTAHHFNPSAFGWDFVFFLTVSLLVLSRMSLKLPHSDFAVSFSDPAIYLAFLFYGGETAIILATLEMAVNCLYLKIKKVKFQPSTIAFNIFGSTLTTSFTFIVWTQIPHFTGINLFSTRIRDLVIILGVLAFTQFLISSTLATVAYSLKDGTSFIRTWKRQCFLTSVTHIVGAVLAGVVYKLINSADLVTIGAAFIIAGFVYLSYRQSIGEINEAVEQAEQAEREKAEVERLRAEQAEKHIEELSILLKKEEDTAFELRESKSALEHAAFHDFLTDLPNRAYFVERLNLLIEIGIEISHRYYVLFLDLTRFKNINDSLGHNVGDKVLKLVGKRLIRILREEDTIARLGGDEFAIILNDMSSIDEAINIAHQIYERLTKPFLLQGNKIYSDLHIGIAPFDVEHKKPEDVLRDADIAMHYAKEKGVGVAVFSKALRSQHLERLKLEADLRFAVERGEMSMHYQPLISLSDGELVGFEALLRWQHPERGLISPAQFVPIAEDSGLIIPITQWILIETCSQLAEWRSFSGSYENLIVSVNISGKHLAEQSLIKHVEKALKISNLPARSLKLEITESVAMENAEQTIQILSKLKEIGVQLSIDDFGTGYSSLNYLHRLPFDMLKIDRSFVHRVGENGENSEILQTIIALAKNLKMRVVAEGIETESQLALLQNMGCDYGQGYLMSRPMPKEEMEKMLYKKKNWLNVIEIHEKNSTIKETEKENLRLF